MSANRHAGGRARTESGTGHPESSPRMCYNLHYMIDRPTPPRRPRPPERRDATQKSLIERVMDAHPQLTRKEAAKAIEEAGG